MFKAINAFFSRVTIRQLIEDELYEAQRKLLNSQARSEVAQADVAAYTTQVNRLKENLKEHTNANTVKE